MKCGGKDYPPFGGELKAEKQVAAIVKCFLSVRARFYKIIPSEN